MKENLKAMKFGIIASITFLVISGIGGYFLIKARTNTNPGLSDTTPNSLYVNNNETLSSAKRNTMIDRFKVYQAKLTHDISLGASAGWTAISDLNLDVPVGASGKILVSLYCTSERGSPYYRLNINNGTSYEYLGYGGGNDTTALSLDAKGIEILFEGYTPGSNQNFKIEWANGTSSEGTYIQAATRPNFNNCRMIAKTW